MVFESQSALLPFSLKSLRFNNVQTEVAFVKSRQEKLCKSALFGLVLLLLFALGSIASVSFVEAPKYTASPGGMKLFRVRVCLLGTFCVGCCILISVLCLSLRNVDKLSAGGVEALLAASAGLASALIVALHPWYLAKAMSINDPYMFMVSDDKLLLDLDLWLTALHFVLPLRWPFLACINVFSFAVFSSVFLILGSQNNTAMDIAILFVLILAETWGKRSLEILERTTFTQIAQERTLRYEAEHKLSSQSRSSDIVAEPDAASLSTSKFTADVFDLRVDGSINSQLIDILECGVREHWLIQPEELHPADDGFISNGGFGMVLIAYYHGEEVAVKVPRVSVNNSTFAAMKSIASELRIFRRLHHPHIVAFHGACIDLATANIALVLEYVPGTPLRTASSSLPSTPLAMSERCLWADNICAALVYLHAQKPSIVHGDIKDTNVIIEQAGTRRKAKLLDFGLSHLLTSSDVSFGGTLHWMAPEVVLQGKNSATTKLDVFSFGRLVYKMMTGRAPLEGMSPAEIKAWARSGSNPPMQWPRSMPLLEEMSSLCDACSSWASAARPSMRDVQARLRVLGLRSDVPDDIRKSLREAFPPRVSSQDLNSVFAMARREDSKMERYKQPLCRKLLNGAFVETSLRSRVLSIESASRRWNVTIRNSCCVLHARLRAIEEVVQKMHTMKCRDISCFHDWQCQTCGLLGDGKCEHCREDIKPDDKNPQRLSNGRESLDEVGAPVMEQKGQPLRRTLLHDAFVETSPVTRMRSITVASLQWNFAIDGACCNLHARLRALDQVTSILRTLKCANSCITYAWQCQTCGLLGDGRCILCNESDDDLERECEERSQTATCEAEVCNEGGKSSVSALIPL